MKLPNRSAPSRLRWDVFCRVIDNLGDAAVCWRLSRQLANEFGCQVRLWIDQPEVLARLVPQVRSDDALTEGVRVAHWTQHQAALTAPHHDEIADVVIAAFGCDLPAGYRQAMRTRRPVWVNLEYLSAETWTLETHGLPSPKPDGLVEHFFFPGPGPHTGGLLRERGLIDARDQFMRDPDARASFLAGMGVRPAPNQRLASLFCYPDAAWPALLEALDRQGSCSESDAGQDAPGSWLMLVPEGVLSGSALHTGSLGEGAVRLGERVFIQGIRFLPQDDYDRLLWSCDLNCVRGEDSLVRALWAGHPMLWQAYPQAQAAHLPKVRAWLDHLLEDREHRIAEAWLAWNDGRPGPDVSAALSDALRIWPTWETRCAALSRREAAGADLTHRLMAFVDERAGLPGARPDQAQ